MNDIQLQEIIKQGESQWVEFERGNIGPEVLASTVCAFANADGGSLIIGIEDRGKAIGVAEAENQAEDLRRTLPALVSPVPAYSVNVREFQGRKLVIIDVPAGQEQPYTANAKIFVRAGSNTRPATGEDISRLIQSRFVGSSRWERLPALGGGISDLDSDEVRRTLRQAADSGLFEFSETADVQEILESLSLAQPGQILNGAIVLFGRRPGRLFPQVRVRAFRADEHVPGSFVDNRVFDGHAFRILDDALGFIQKHVPITSVLPQQGLRRKEKISYPVPVLREALINAIVHRDYAAFDGGVTVSVFSDHIQIWNSGTLPTGMKVEDFRRPHPSRPHNPDIAHVFLLRGFMERLGTGSARMIEWCREAKLPEPEWRADGNGVTVTLWLRMPKKKADDINVRERKLLRHLSPGKSTNLKEYRQLIGMNIQERQCRKDLAELVNWSFLRREGRGKLTRYVRLDAAI